MKGIYLEQFARIGTALANPARLALLDLLCQGEKTVETLVDQSGLPVKNVSAQLKVLREAGLVRSRREGKFVHYSLSDARVAEFWSTLQSFASSQLAEMQEVTKALLSDPNSLSGFDGKQLVSKAAKGELVVIDVRPADEYAFAHLPYAISMPLSELKGKLKSLPKDKKIIAYCRGPFCLFAKEAVELLRRKGFEASRIEEGVTEWRAKGNPLATES